MSKSEIEKIKEKQKYIEHPKAKYDFRGEYINNCECGKQHTLFTQDDNHPEYYSNVNIKCECGRFVSFSLPVN